MQTARRFSARTFLPALILAACGGGNTMSIAVTPSATAAVNDGQTPTQIVATIMANGSSVPDGTSVSLTVNSGAAASFAVFAPATAATKTVMVSTAGGSATAQVFDVADEVVTVNILASLTDSGGNTYTISGTTSVTFGGKCKDAFVAAPPTSTQSGVPGSIDLACNSDYMGGIFPFDEETIQLYTGNTQGCIATVNDASQQSVAGAAVQFLTEAGTFETDVIATGQHPTEITAPTGLANVAYHVSSPYPEDVDWTNQDGTLLASPGGTATVKREWTGVDANDNPHTYNPRDGWVTMIAAVPGIPSSNQIGPCTATSCPEPYVDSNDNGQWDLGEPFIDVNCNGQWDSQQVADAEGYIDIWNYKTIVWTDGVWDGASCASGETGCTGSGVQGDSPPGCSNNISANTSCNITFRFVDKNLNLLSTFLTSGDNQIAFTLSGAATESLTTTIDTEGLDQALDAQSLTQNPDFTVGVTDSATPSPYGSAPYTLNAAGTFVFVDPSVTQPTELVAEQTITLSAGGNAQIPSN